MQGLVVAVVVMVVHKGGMRDVLIIILILRGRVVVSAQQIATGNRWYVGDIDSTPIFRLSSSIRETTTAQAARASMRCRRRASRRYTFGSATAS